MSKAPMESRSTPLNQNSDKQYLEIDNNEEPIEMPQHDDSCEEEINKLKDDDRRWGKFFVSKNRKKRNDESTFQNSHETEPRENPISQTDTAVGSSVTAIDSGTMQKVIPAAVHQPKLYSYDIVPSKSLIRTTVMAELSFGMLGEIKNHYNQN